MEEPDQCVEEEKPDHWVVEQEERVNVEQGRPHYDEEKGLEVEEEQGQHVEEE